MSGTRLPGMTKRSAVRSRAPCASVNVREGWYLGMGSGEGAGREAAKRGARGQAGVTRGAEWHRVNQEERVDRYHGREDSDAGDCELAELVREGVRGRAIGCGVDNETNAGFGTDHGGVRAGGMFTFA